MIRLADIRFRWRSRDPLALDIPELTVDSGEKLFVRGPSGGGKTTLLNLIGGTVEPEAGTVSILGTEIAALRGGARDAFRADHIGFVFQMFNLVPYLPLIDNVLLPCRFSARRRERAGARPEVEAHRLLAHMELDAERLAGRPVSRLSQGEQQRVAVARALIGSPELVIADEPTSALDEDAREAFLSLLMEEVDKAGATLVFVSHDARLEPAFGRSL
ncbi:MAG: ABC transporter ATP-binding protein, partial [Defluviicoccus sp.]|nr:ABC transporter ATP-binding protein [Defluviicoccus sp.]